MCIRHGFKEKAIDYDIERLKRIDSICLVIYWNSNLADCTYGKILICVWCIFRIQIGVYLFVGVGCSFFSSHFDCSFLSCLVSSYFADFWFHYCMPYGHFCRRIAASAAAKFFCSFVHSVSIYSNDNVLIWLLTFSRSLLATVHCVLFYVVVQCFVCIYQFGLVYLLFFPTLTFVCLIYIVIRIHFSFSRLMCVYTVFWSFHHDWTLLHTLWLSFGYNSEIFKCFLFFLTLFVFVFVSKDLRLSFTNKNQVSTFFWPMYMTMMTRENRWIFELF